MADMLMISITSPDIDAWAVKLKAVGNGVGEVIMRDFIVKATATIKASIDMKVPVKTGDLRSTLHGTTVGLVGTIWSTSKYGGYVEYGTKPHVIVPSTKQAMSWVGGKHAVRLVNHPGTKANPFFENGTMEAMPAVTALEVELITKLEEAIKI